MMAFKIETKIEDAVLIKSTSVSVLAYLYSATAKPY